MKQKAVLITGASNGIGLCFAELFAKQSHDVILVARSVNKLAEIKEELTSRFKIKVEIVPLDLSIKNAASDLFEVTKKSGFQVTHLINNAGFGDYGLFHQADFTKSEDMMQLNMVCLAQLCRLFSHEMTIAKEGKILNVASVAAFNPGPEMALYFATKAFVLSLSEALHEELEPYGISVTALCPGPTETGFVAAANLQNSRFFKQKMPTAKKIAQFGYDALEKNKALAIPGFLNNIQVFLLRLTPRGLVRKLTGKILKMK